MQTCFDTKEPNLLTGFPFSQMPKGDGKGVITVINLDDDASSSMSNLKEENDSLKCQLEAYKNEVDLVKQEQKNAMDEKDKQLRTLQQALQGMQQVGWE